MVQVWVLLVTEICGMWNGPGSLTKRVPFRLPCWTNPVYCTGLLVSFTHSVYSKKLKQTQRSTVHMHCARSLHHPQCLANRHRSDQSECGFLSQLPTMPLSQVHGGESWVVVLQNLHVRLGKAVQRLAPYSPVLGVLLRVKVRFRITAAYL